MVAPRKGPAGIAAPPAVPAVITAPPADPAPVQEVGFDIVFDETQFKEFITLDPSSGLNAIDFSIIVPSDFANAVVAAARNKAGNDTPTASQWIAAAIEKARRVRPAVEAGKLTTDQGVCVLTVICFMAYTAARQRGDSIDAAMKVVEGIGDELLKPQLPNKVDPAAMTVEAPKTPAPATGSPAPSSADGKIKLIKPTSKPPATSNPSGRRSTTPTDVMERVGAAAAEGGFGDSIRPTDAAEAKAKADAKRQADAEKAEADRKKAEAEHQAAEAKAETERKAKQTERERLLAEARAKADADKAEADRKKAEAQVDAVRRATEAKAKAAEAETKRLDNIRFIAGLEAERIRLEAEHKAARAKLAGAERAQLDALHKGMLLKLDAEIAALNTGRQTKSSSRFTKVVFTIIGLLIVLGLVIGGIKLAESLPASAQQPIPTVTVPPVTPMPGVETCGPVTAALLEYYLGGNDPTRYVDRGQKYAKNGARLQCEGRQRNLGNNSYDVSACNICYTP